jgi:prepilin-type N-terminal cleavage/methylation domain-containing protein
MARNLKLKKGFTLIELLVVISIIALLSSVVMAALNGATNSANLAANEQFDANILHGIGDQLVGQWTFNDNPANNNPVNTVLDTSGFGNNGTVSGAIWNTTGGFDGKGYYSFNGSNDIYTTLKNVNNTNTVTFTAWVKDNNSNTGVLTGAIVIVGRNGGGFCGLTTGPNNELRFAWDNSYWNWSTGLIMPTNKWNFVVMSVSPTKVVLYMNQKVYTSPNINPIQVNFSAVNDFNIGYDPGQSSGWNGDIDDVRVYTEAYTSMDIQKLYAEGLKTHQNLALK